MPGFHHSVAILPRCRFAVPFCRSVVPLSRSVVPLPLPVRTEMLETSCRMHGDEETRTLIGRPPYGRTAKIGFNPIATERRLRRKAGGNGNGATDFFT